MLARIIPCESDRYTDRSPWYAQRYAQERDAHSVWSVIDRWLSDRVLCGRYDPFVVYVAGIDSAYAIMKRL